MIGMLLDLSQQVKVPSEKEHTSRPKAEFVPSNGSEKKVKMVCLSLMEPELCLNIKNETLIYGIQFLKTIKNIYFFISLSYLCLINTPLKRYV